MLVTCLRWRLRELTNHLWQQFTIAQPKADKRLSCTCHWKTIIFDCLTVISVLFSSLERGITQPIRMLCFVLIAFFWTFDVFRHYSVIWRKSMSGLFSLFTCCVNDLTQSRFPRKNFRSSLAAGSESCVFCNGNPRRRLSYRIINGTRSQNQS